MAVVHRLDGRQPVELPGGGADGVAKIHHLLLVVPHRELDASGEHPLQPHQCHYQKRPPRPKLTYQLNNIHGPMLPPRGVALGIALDVALELDAGHHGAHATRATAADVGAPLEQAARPERLAALVDQKP